MKRNPSFALSLQLGLRSGEEGKGEELGRQRHCWHTEFNLVMILMRRAGLITFSLGSSIFQECKRSSHFKKFALEE